MKDQKIIPHLWFDNEVVEAAHFYTSLFPNSKIISSNVIEDTPSGDASFVEFQLMDFKFMGINGGPYFKMNPSISFIVNFNPAKDSDAVKNIDRLWASLLQGGKTLMPLQKYDFADYYGWLEDRYGVSWQFMLNEPSKDPNWGIVPSLMFVGEVAGKAEEATDFYMSVFKNSKRDGIYYYPEVMEFDKPNSVIFSAFSLENMCFAANDSGIDHDFMFNEGVSLLIYCNNQEEIDYYWDKLSHVPESEQCGWLKDKYGVSWQVHSKILDELMRNGSKEQKDRVTKAFLKMKKFNIQELLDAYNNK